ncbi:MAG: hypothetical protein ACSLFP_15615 [Acidimicrobiales bacterium]
MELTPPAVLRSIAGGRVAYGLAMALLPRRLLKLQSGEEPSGSFIWLGRVFGIRDAVLGIGALVAPDAEQARAWYVAGAVADTCDLVAAAGGRRHLGGKGALVASLVAASAAGAGWWALTQVG